MSLDNVLYQPCAAFVLSPRLHKIGVKKTRALLNVFYNAEF